MRANTVRTNFFVAVGTLGELGDSQSVVSAASRGSPLRVTAFWIWHEIFLVSQLAIWIFSGLRPTSVRRADFGPEILQLTPAIVNSWSVAVAIPQVSVSAALGADAPA